MSRPLPSKDPDAVENYYIVWCSKDGTNANTAADSGELKGATISTSSWTVIPSGTLTIDSNSLAAVTIAGVSFGINTVAAVQLSAGTVGQTYKLRNQITTSDNRTLNKTIEVSIEEL